MPDGDKIPIGVSGKWLKVFKSLDARDSVERIADAVVGAVASDVRRAGGLSGLGRLGGLPDAESRASRSSVRSEPPGELVGAFTGEVALALSDHLALVSGHQASYRFAERLVERLAWNKFDRMMTRLVGDKKYSVTELLGRFRQVLSDEQVRNLVRRILRHPTGDGLRAPNKRTRRLSPQELLNTDLESL
jgi:hypothetical protein